MIKIAVLVSGGGTNLQSLIDNTKNGYIPGKIVLVISNNPDAYALKRAENEGIEHVVIKREDFNDKEEFSKAIMKETKKREVDLICLAGFLKKLGRNIIEEYKNRIMNIHPALLPSYGGRGMYGKRVHKAVLEAGDTVSGCTIHFVDEKYDHGPVIIQEKVPVKEDDTPESLAKRVLKVEHRLYPKAVRMFATGKIQNKRREPKND